MKELLQSQLSLAEQQLLDSSTRSEYSEARSLVSFLTQLLDSLDQ